MIRGPKFRKMLMIRLLKKMLPYLGKFRDNKQKLQYHQHFDWHKAVRLSDRRGFGYLELKKICSAANNNKL